MKESLVRRLRWCLFCWHACWLAQRNPVYLYGLELLEKPSWFFTACPTSPCVSGSTFQRSFCQFAWCRQRSGCLALLRSYLETTLKLFYSQDNISLILAFNWHSSGIFLSAFFCQLDSKLQLQHLPLHILPTASTHSFMSHTAVFLSPGAPLMPWCSAGSSPSQSVYETNHFSFCSTLWDLIFCHICPAPFLDSDFLPLQLCYKTIVDTKPRHTFWKSAKCLGTL